jgi:hypothetical protein
MAVGKLPIETLMATVVAQIWQLMASTFHLPDYYPPLPILPPPNHNILNH